LDQRRGIVLKSAIMAASEIILDGLAFPEGPRWRDGLLWFSDMHAQRVMTVDPQGVAHTVVEVPNDPSGLGWLPDGRLLVVSMRDRKLLRLDASGLTEHADLGGIATFHCNDMVVDAQGRAYVGNFGADFQSGAAMVPAALALVEPDGGVRVAADDLMFPNGTVITPDGRTLVVGESFASRMTAFDIEDDGSLTNRRVWAQLENALPDGCCLDAEGAIWVASPISSEVLRVHEGGRVSQRIEVDTQAIACMLGGEDRKTLFILTAGTLIPEEAAQRRDGRIEVVQVEVPGAGLP
jgi:sugar lactone lactonase YvrE